MPVGPGISLLNQPRHAANAEDESRGAQVWFGLINSFYQSLNVSDDHTGFKNKNEERSIWQPVCLDKQQLMWVTLLQGNTLHAADRVYIDDTHSFRHRFQTENPDGKKNTEFPPKLLMVFSDENLETSWVCCFNGKIPTSTLKERKEPI